MREVEIVPGWCEKGGGGGGGNLENIKIYMVMNWLSNLSTRKTHNASAAFHS
jgi:hypothetical protein